MPVEGAVIALTVRSGAGTCVAVTAMFCDDVPPAASVAVTLTVSAPAFGASMVSAARSAFICASEPANVIEVVPRPLPVVDSRSLVSDSVTLKLPAGAAVSLTLMPLSGVIEFCVMAAVAGALVVGGG